MAINKLALYERARNLGSTKSYEEFLEILNGKQATRAAMPMMMSVDGLDEVDGLDGNPKHYFRLWDKKSAINNIAPEKIFESRPVIKQPGAELLMVYKDGGLIILQDTDPEQGGNVPMDVARANEVGQKFVDQWYEEENDKEVSDAIVEEMLMGQK